MNAPMDFARYADAIRQAYRSTRQHSISGNSPTNYVWTDTREPIELSAIAAESRRVDAVVEEILAQFRVELEDALLEANPTLGPAVIARIFDQTMSFVQDGDEYVVGEAVDESRYALIASRAQELASLCTFAKENS